MSFNAEMKVVRFGSEDVIATSGLHNGSKMVFSNFANGNFADNKITVDGRNISFGSNPTPDDIISAIGADGDTKIWSEYSSKYRKMSAVMESLINNDDTSVGAWDFTYIYDSLNNRFDKQ